MKSLGWSKPKGKSDTRTPELNAQPDAELFLWAILMGRTEMASIFWRRQEPVRENLKFFQMASA